MVMILWRATMTIWMMIVFTHWVWISMSKITWKMWWVVKCTYEELHQIFPRLSASHISLIRMDHCPFENFNLWHLSCNQRTEGINVFLFFRLKWVLQLLHSFIVYVAIRTIYQEHWKNGKFHMKYILRNNRTKKKRRIWNYENGKHEKYKQSLDLILVHDYEFERRKNKRMENAVTA